MWSFYDDTQDQLAALWESQAREAWGDDYFDRPGEPPDDDETDEAAWYERVMRDYDATRRESGYRPGQE